MHKSIASILIQLSKQRWYFVWNSVLGTIKTYLWHSPIYHASFFSSSSFCCSLFNFYSFMGEATLLHHEVSITYSHTELDTEGHLPSASWRVKLDLEASFLIHQIINTLPSLLRGIRLSALAPSYFYSFPPISHPSLFMLLLLLSPYIPPPPPPAPLLL